MKRLTRAQLFAPAKRARNTQDWFERVKLVVVAARDRAVEEAEQRTAPSMKRLLLCCRDVAWLRGWRNMGSSFRRVPTSKPAQLDLVLWFAPSTS